MDALGWSSSQRFDKIDGEKRKRLVKEEFKKSAKQANKCTSY